MPRNPAQYRIQRGLKSLGYDPGKPDGWYGTLTATAARALYAGGPIKQSEWALGVLQRGLIDLGYYRGRRTKEWDTKTRAALGALIDADGRHIAAKEPGEVLTPAKPKLIRPDHPNRLLQGTAGHVIDTYCLHCAAVPGNWWRGKSNHQMLKAITDMHVLPKGQGGNGWSAIGYHKITFPDGETLLGRPLDRIGAGARGYNRGVVHHLMIEIATINRTRRPEDYFRPETLAATKDQLEEIAGQTPITRLMGHREVANKLCPGFEVIGRDWTTRAVA